MTVSLITTINRYLGLTSDTKPASAVVGSQFIEVDSGLVYIWDGTTWRLDLDAMGGTVPSFAIFDQIITILGANKQSFWPCTDAWDADVYPHGAGSVGLPFTLATGAIWDSLDPVQLNGALNAYHKTATTPVLTAVDNTGFSHGNGTVDTPFSCGMWIKPTAALGSVQSIIAKYGNTLSQREYDFRFDASGRLVLELYDESADTTEIATAADGGVVTPFKWNFCVATYDGGETDPRIHLYINGVDQNAAGLSVESGAYVSMDNGTGLLMIGARDAVATVAQTMLGRLTLPFMTGKELTAAEVAQLYGLTRALVGA